MSKSRSSYWKNHPGSAVLRLLVWLSAVITVAVMAFLVGFILIKGVGNLKPELFALEYNSENASLMPALINTLIITLLSLLIAVPFGIFAAIYLVEYAKKRKQACKNNSYNNRDIAGNSIYHFWLVWTFIFQYGTSLGILFIIRSYDFGNYDSSFDHPYYRRGTSWCSGCIQRSLLWTWCRKASYCF